MRKVRNANLASSLFSAAMFGLAASPAAADSLDGRVLAGGQPVTGSTVTLWAAGPARRKNWRRRGPTRRAISRSTRLARPAGRLALSRRQGRQFRRQQDAGDNPALALLTVLGAQAAAQGDDQRNDDHCLGLDPRAVHRQARRSRVPRSACASPPAMCRTSSICEPAATAA